MALKLILNSKTYLMDKGSSPTPGASDVGSTTKRNKNKQREFVFETKSKRDMVLQKSQIKENNNNNFLLVTAKKN